MTDVATQSRIIPQSVRSDGSVRKERRVREGFVPKEDIAKYKPGQGRLRGSTANKEGPADLKPSDAASTQVLARAEAANDVKATTRKKGDALDEALAKLSLGDTSSSRWA